VVTFPVVELPESELNLGNNVVGDKVDRNVVGDRRACMKFPTIGVFLLLDADADKMCLDVEHVVLHEREDSDALAIVLQSVTGDDVWVAPGAADRTRANAECLLKARNDWGLLDRGCFLTCDKYCRDGSEDGEL